MQESVSILLLRADGWGSDVIQRTARADDNRSTPSKVVVAPPGELPAPPKSLGRHQTFHLRDGWLSKGMRAVSASSVVLSEPDAHHHLGVGKNMLAAIRFWLEAFELARRGGSDPRRREGLALTDLGELLLKYDPYLEDPGSLWILHSVLVGTGGPAAAWYWFFNEDQASGQTLEELAGAFMVWMRELAPDVRVTEQASRRELSCLLRTYVASDAGDLTETELMSPLSTLSLINIADKRAWVNLGTHDGMPVEVFAGTLARFHRKHGHAAYQLDDLRWAPLSPGRVLCLDTPALTSQLLRAQGEGIVRVSFTAGLRSVVIDQEATEIEWFRRYFEHAAP